ncbi:MAG: hypothetical protein K0R73_1378 [Candidatus Midichloriaceae bacterium]|jgi:predicted nucleotidyltransferase component of viral defense system|nr:hypothetical protein [Candidatus Midichloriaceae bacterium]
MIPKQEILRAATYTGLSAHVIEKDYVLGWLLAGINSHEALSNNWVFKGGTCMKKCYFETYRFSEDLDFTLKTAAHLNKKFLKKTFMEIGEWIYEASGIEFAAEFMKFDIFENPRGKLSCEGRIFYRGPIAPTSARQLPRIKLDLTTDELIVETPVVNIVKHPYSDEPQEKIKIQCYPYIEMFAEKIRALAERTRPRDLYDVINFYHLPESRNLAKEVHRVLLKKCEFKNIPFPTHAALDMHRLSCMAGWNDQLAHQLPVLPAFESFWGQLPEFFNWLVE